MTYRTGNEMIMVAVGSNAFGGLIRLNKTAALIVDCLKNETTEEDISTRMSLKYDAPIEIIKTDVSKIITKLKAIGAIDE